MRKLWLGIVATMLMVVFVAPASAYEFSMTGTWLWGFDYMAGSGSNDFFGTRDHTVIAPGAGPHWAGLNTWVGARTIDGQQYGVVSGKDASLQWMRVEFQPEFRINQAVRLRGAYQIGSPNLLNANNADGNYGLYPNSMSYGVWSPMAGGSWTQFWMTAQTPWGILIAGKRPFAWGIGAQYDGSNATAESLGVIAPYGPFRIGFGGYPWRGQTWINSQTGRQIISTVSSGRPNAGINGAQIGSQNYRLWDNEAKRQFQPFGFVTYDNGPLSVGVLYEWLALHNSPLGSNTGTIATTTGRTYDETFEDGSVFMKYNNGRFFANMELAWGRGQITTIPGMADNTNFFADGYGASYADGTSVAPRYTEVWKWMMEIGALCGPAKISALWSWVPGPDRRQGVWINNQSWENVANGTFLGNAQAYLPYSLLMGYQYGAGLNALNSRGEGYMTDANSYGVRLDYAAAANLNLYFTGFYADRVSNGWPWGIMTLTGAAAGNGASTTLLGTYTAAAAQPAVQNIGGPNSAPNIPDNSLGWEVTTGVDWKLLEGFKTTFRGAYWQPGAWFKYATVDRGTATAAAIAPATSLDPRVGIGPMVGAQGVNPSKSIDGIYMFQATMQVDF